MAVVAADYATVVTNCRNAIAHGTNLSGKDLLLVISVVEHAANTLDGLTSGDDITDVTASTALDGGAA